MPAEIHKQVLDYQGGDANAALELVEKFKPLIKRYAFFLHREDSFEDLQRFLLSMLKTWDTSRLSSTDDATVTRYIANSVKNEYIALSKQKAKERGTSYLEDATLPQALEYAQKTSTCDQYDQLTLQDLHKVLNEYEFAIVYAIYFEQRSVAEVARQKHKTRQAINQTKIKALQKIKEAWGKEQKHCNITVKISTESATWLTWSAGTDMILLDYSSNFLYSKTKELLNNFKKNAKENVDEKKT